MGIAFESLKKIVDKINVSEKAKQVFVTDIGGKPIDWNMKFQFNLNNEEPFYLETKSRKAILKQGTVATADIIMFGDNNSIVKICNGKGDFTHAISREEIVVEKGKMIEIIRLTRAIAIVLKA